MSIEAVKLFEQSFGYKPTHVVRAPGRLELIGNHTDYNEGLVMGLAVDRYVFMAAAPRADGQINLASSAFSARESFSATDLHKNPQAAWADYPKGVLEQLRRRNVRFGGFDALVHSTIPIGAGMSSSAALEVATALTLRQLYPYSLSQPEDGASAADEEGDQWRKLDDAERMHLARLCQAAENQFVGVQCGLLDQICSLFGKAAHAIEIDCRSLGVDYVPMRGELAIVVCQTGKKHALAGGEYNELRRCCEAAARKLGVPSLRAVDPARLEADKPRLTEREYQCAYHIVGEIQRVELGARALRENDLVRFGQYMFESHASSRDYFKNSTPELDLLVELARQHRGCLGARLTGAGFGGATINLVQAGLAEDFAKAVAAAYEQKTGLRADPMLCQIADGAG